MQLWPNGTHALSQQISSYENGIKDCYRYSYFWCGFKLGEMTGVIKAEYGRGMREVDQFQTTNGGWQKTSGVMIPATNSTTITPAQQ